MSTETAKVFNGDTVIVGDTVVHTTVSSNHIVQRIRIVEKIEHGRIYLSGGGGQHVRKPEKLIKYKSC